MYQPVSQAVLEQDLFLCCFVTFLLFWGEGLHLQHMEVLRLEVELELQLLAYATATATWNSCQVCNLYHSSWQRQILNPLSKARYLTCILVDTSWVHNLLSHRRNSLNKILKELLKN